MLKSLNYGSWFEIEGTTGVYLKLTSPPILQMIYENIPLFGISVAKFYKVNGELNVKFMILEEDTQNIIPIKVRFEVGSMPLPCPNKNEIEPLRVIEIGYRKFFIMDTIAKPLGTGNIPRWNTGKFVIDVVDGTQYQSFWDDNFCRVTNQKVVDIFRVNNSCKIK